MLERAGHHQRYSSPVTLSGVRSAPCILTAAAVTLFACPAWAGQGSAEEVAALGTASGATSTPAATSTVDAPLLPLDYALPLRKRLPSTMLPPLIDTGDSITVASGPSPFVQLITSVSGGPIGDIDGIDVRLRNRVGTAGDIVTQLQFARSTPTLDIHFDITGDKSLRQDRGALLSYDGSAFIHPGGVLYLGAEAKGPMETLGRAPFVMEGYVGPEARVNLGGIGRGLTAETGVMFVTTGERDAAGRDQLNFTLSLPF